MQSPPAEPSADDNGQPAPESPSATFQGMGLSDTMLASLKNACYDTPSPVQAGVIPVALQGKDVLGQARTGTGKTASFGIPILEMLADNGRGAPPQALVLAPTRELAVQVRDEIDKLAHGRKVRTLAVYGGKPIKGQVDKLQRGAEIVVGTPGRVLDLLARGFLVLEQLRCVVLDEADRMLDIGFRPDIEKILRKCPRQRQTLLLSATLAPGVQRLARQYMIEPTMLDFSPKTATVDTIEQFYFTVDERKKFELLVRLLKRDDPAQAIIFTRTKRGADKVYTKLTGKVKSVDCIHGDLNQSQRDRVMRKFRADEVTLLVATDVVGRGIDVSNISHIVNYDMPQSSDDYVHRVGRTGRMGRDGVAYTFVTPEQGGELTRIEMLINKELTRDQIEGFEAAAPVAQKATEQRQARFFGIKGESQAPPAPAEPAAPVEPAEPEPPKPAPFGKRPRKRHRKAL
ncbi:DEAD/DEAH box helicase [Pirellulimonas nuda]|uniref:DEAD/DEAH box helicase n=1 Tax=Pirellulimonas nuda TaxID=2528009 RepID=UPI0037046176